MAIEKVKGIDHHTIDALKPNSARKKILVRKVKLV